MFGLTKRRAVGSRAAHVISKTLMAAVVVTAAGSAAAEPVAMVLDRTEGVAFPAFAELSPGDVITMQRTDHVDLLDYTRCREVRIKSGTVSATSGGLVIEGGLEQELRAGNCLTGPTGNGGQDAKGLTVTLRGIQPDSKVAASLMLRFNQALRNRFDNVFVSFGGGPPQQFEMMDKVMTEMPSRSSDDETVDIEVFLQGSSAEAGVEVRQFTLDPAQVGRRTAVVVVK